MPFDQKKILQLLSQVQEPDQQQDIVRLGMVRNLSVTAELVSFTLLLPSPLCLNAAQIQNQCRTLLVDVAEVRIDLDWQVRQPLHQNKRPIPGVRNIIAVASGKGGVGKSTLCMNLAVALEQAGARVGILDCDLFGPSLPAMVGYHQPVALDDERFIIPHELFQIQLLSLGFMSGRDEAVLLRGPVLQRLLGRLAYETRWDDLDYLLLDLPPGTGDIQLTITRLLPLSGAILVATPQDIAIRDVRRGVSMFRTTQVPLLGLVENMSYYLCPSCDERHQVFRQGGTRALAEEMVVPFLGELPLAQNIASGLGDGTPFLVREPEHAVAHQMRHILSLALSQLQKQNLFWAQAQSDSLEV